MLDLFADEKPDLFLTVGGEVIGKQLQVCAPEGHIAALELEMLNFGQELALGNDAFDRDIGFEAMDETMGIVGYDMPI